MKNRESIYCSHNLQYTEIMRKLLQLLCLSLCLLWCTPVHVEDITSMQEDKLYIFDIDMNDQNPLSTLKTAVLKSRCAYDASINYDDINMDLTTISTDAFDRTKAGLQKINLSANIIRNDSTSYNFMQLIAVRMLQPDGPQIILKQNTVNIDLNSSFNYGDNIGYVACSDGKLPAIKEWDNVDTSNEGTYSCSLELLDSSGKETEITYTVNVQKPVEVIRAEEEEAARKEEEERQAQLALQAGIPNYGKTFTLDASATDIISYARQFLGCNYVWGGTSPITGFDCSGFTQYVYAAFGISLPHSSDGQSAYGRIVSPDEALPGDLVTYNGHAAIYVGGGMIINAMDYNLGVRECSMYGVSNGNMQIHRLW